MRDDEWARCLLVLPTHVHERRALGTREPLVAVGCVEVDVEVGDAERLREQSVRAVHDDARVRTSA